VAEVEKNEGAAGALIHSVMSSAYVMLLTRKLLTDRMGDAVMDTVGSRPGED
jgi:hypothetical protein